MRNVSNFGRPRAVVGDDDDGTEIWRERPFAMLLDGELVTGIFDRVEIRPDTGGSSKVATVIDFKSDKIEAKNVSERAASHAPQLHHYRKAAAKLLSLPEQRISCVLVFTHLCQLVEL